MEIRCGSCQKLFRVSDDKITGKGIKFACTRCGDSVKITREDFANHIVSQSALSALDMFEPKVKSAVAPASEAGAPAIEETPVAFEAGVEGEGPAEEPVSKPGSVDLPSSAPDFLQEKEEPAYSEPAAFEEMPLPADMPQSPGQERESSPGLEGSLPGPLVGQMPEQKPEPQQQPKLEPKPEPQPKLEAKREPVSQPASEPKPVVRPGQAAAVIAGPAASPVAPAAPKKEPLRPAEPAPPAAARGAAPPIPRRSTVMAVVIALVVLSLAGAGAFLYLRSPAPPAPASAPAMTSMEGLHILNASGSMEPNGDLLISGAVLNTTDKERTAWYVVVEVFDANGTVMNKIRLLNGKQLYTRSDYEILAKRGMNVQELRAGVLQGKGAIPPQGNVAFELRYLQPPVGIASFNATLQPFEPARLYKEIAEDSK